jgi:hypothetical protein
MPEVVVENLRSAVYASHEKLTAQVAADSALDSKLMGLLGFFVAVAGLLLSLLHGPHDGRPLLLAGVTFGALACLVGSMGGSTPNTGPPPRQFYADYGARAEADYLTQLLADLALTADRNRKGLKRRQQALAIAVSAPIPFAILYGLLAIA